MVYTDGIHLISDESIDELVSFGKGIGLKPEWIHHTPGRPHFDLVRDSLLQQALRHGAIRLPRREFVSALRRMPSYKAWKARRNAD